MSMKSWRRLMPALLIVTSTPPRSRSTSRNAPSTAAASATSAGRTPASFGSLARRARPPASSRSITTTREPSSRNRSTVAAPIPLAPPVITTRLPARPFMRAPEGVRPAVRRSVGDAAAVHHQRRAGHERRIVRGEKERRPRQLRDRADPAERPGGGALHVVLVAYPAGLGVVSEHRSLDVAGAETVHADALLAVIDRHR